MNDAHAKAQLVRKSYKFALLSFTSGSEANTAKSESMTEEEGEKK